MPALWPCAVGTLMKQTKRRRRMLYQRRNGLIVFRPRGMRPPDSVAAHLGRENKKSSHSRFWRGVVEVGYKGKIREES